MSEPFRNDPIPIDDVPQLTDDAFVPVDPRYLRASLFGTGITALIVLAIGSFVAMQVDATTTAAAITGGILAYQLRDHDISKRSGVITHRVESLPFARVQHVRVNRGAIERALGLATLQISSAGPNIIIPGLTDAEASRIKLLVTERAGMEPDDTDDPSAAVTPPAPTPPAPPAAAPPATMAPAAPPTPRAPPTAPPVPPPPAPPAPAAPPVAPPTPPAPPAAPPGLPTTPPTAGPPPPPG